MLSVGIAVTFWNTGVPGMKYGASELNTWFKRKFGSNTAPLPFVANHIRLIHNDQHENVPEIVALVKENPDTGLREWERLGDFLFEGAGALRSS
jgi:hypothetical protein